MELFERDDFEIDEFAAGNRREKNRRKSRRTSVLFMVGCALAFIVVMALCILLYIRVDEGHQEDEETMANSEITIMYTQEEMEEKAALLAEEEKQKLLDRLAESLNSGNTVVETLRTLYTDDIVVASDGKYHFWRT